MNKQFKERLTGAVILVVFIVIVVPALLSGPPRPATPVTVTGVEGPPIRSYTIDLTEPAGTQPPITPLTVTPSSPSAPVSGADLAPTSAPATTPAPLPTPTPAPVAGPGSASVETGFAVQIGSFANRANAEGLVAKLGKGGFPAFISPTGSGRKLYRVRVGPVADRAGALQLAARLAEAGQPGKVVDHP
ncbi:MAG: SPOR domain-containing protein [Steroidobacteraceae bacterium]|nr:SPOR domain-containing protein [Steroidobacteraceae bacterium]